MIEKDMEFNEQLLTYQEAVTHVQKYERLYKTASEEFFAALEKGEASNEIHPDDIYEWRSYLAFKKDIEARLATVLGDNGEPIDEVEYSPNSGLHVRSKAQANQSLALAA